jgi:hypothetical protein
MASWLCPVLLISVKKLLRLYIGTDSRFRPRPGLAPAPKVKNKARITGNLPAKPRRRFAMLAQMSFNQVQQTHAVSPFRTAVIFNTPRRIGV